MSERSELTHQVVSELKDMRDHPPFEPTPDIDMVWVLSAPGTAKEAANDGAYSGASFDRMNIDAGVQAVLDITARRLGKPSDEITREDVETHGPVLFYNGEDEATERGKYRQNEAFEELASDPNFPIPRSKIIIDRISEIATPAQVKGLAEYLRNTNQRGAKIAVVSLFAHAPRVGRYLEHYKDLFPAAIEFVNAPAGMTIRGLAASFREANKIVQYYEMGHLAKDSIFQTEAEVTEAETYSALHLYGNPAIFEMRRMEGFDIVSFGKGPWVPEKGARVVGEFAMRHPDGRVVSLVTYKIDTSGMTFRPRPQEEEFEGEADFQRHIEEWQVRFGPSVRLSRYTNYSTQPRS